MIDNRSVDNGEIMSDNVPDMFEGDLLNVSLPGDILLTLINFDQSWVIHIPRNVWDEITASFPHFTDCITQFWQ